jgi:hypothetical protein
VVDSLLEQAEIEIKRQLAMGRFGLENRRKRAQLFNAGR